MSDRAVVFVDGNNLYHGLKDAGAKRIGKISLAKFARKLVGPREWVGLRYYVGRVSQSWSEQDYAAQRSYVAQQMKADHRVTFHFGRLEFRPQPNPASEELLRYLADLRTPIDPTVRTHLMDLGHRHRKAKVMVEKAVDVMLAVDVVTMALTDAYDAAYIISADGDYTHAVEFVRGRGKKVYGAAATPAHEMGKVVNAFIKLTREFVADCYFDEPPPERRGTK